MQAIVPPELVEPVIRVSVHRGNVPGLLFWLLLLLLLRLLASPCDSFVFAVGLTPLPAWLHGKKISSEVRDGLVLSYLHLVLPIERSWRTLEMYWKRID